MRRLLIATLLGATLCTPAFAADASDTQPAALVIAPTAIAAATSPAASLDLATRSNWKYGRPTILPALYVTSAALQGYDAYSTLTALKNGGREVNPLMQGIVKRPAAFVAMKAGVTMASIMAAESLWKNHHRFGAIGLMVASNLMMGVVAKHNAQVLSTLK